MFVSVSGWQFVQWTLRSGGVLALVLVFLLQLVLAELRRPEADLEEADERLIQVLPRAVGVQQVPLVRVDLNTWEGGGALHFTPTSNKL